MAITTKIISQEVEVTDKILCDNCNKDIPLVFNASQTGCIQGRNLLHVEFSGGYAEYVDGQSDVHLCGTCADKLRKVFPLFEKVLRRTFVGSCSWRNDVAWAKDEDSLVDDVIQVKLEAERNKEEKA